MSTVSSDPAIPEALRAALIRRGFDELTSVQRAVLEPEALERNLRISSQTGSGKTLALGFVISRDLIGELPPRALLAIVVTPTRELAMQVKEELSWLFADLPGVRVEAVTGGTDIQRERTVLRRAPAVLVATPGRLLDHIRRSSIDCKFVRQLVLDEADRMLDMGFREDLEAIVEALPVERKSHLVSATFPPQVRKLADKVQADAMHLQGTTLGSANADIEHVAMLVERGDDYAALVNALLLAPGERVLMFVERRADTTGLADRLTADGFAAQAFSGELSQPQRTRTLEAFRNGVVDILVSTDVAARGIDVPDITLVIHAEMPDDADSYTHRSGRTGRAGRKGKSLLLVPSRARRHADVLLKQAKVQVAWRPLPTPEEIHEVLAERTRGIVQQQLEDAAAPSVRSLAQAAELLDGRDPVRLVATLLAMAGPELPRAPMPTRVVQGDEQRRRPTRSHEARPQGRFVRFSINWGHRKGATPARLLSHVCRRGEITSGQIGAIEIGEATATFEVAERASGDFEARVRTPDRRDPHLEIQRHPDAD
ncbi:MAG: DEAD/DEAH box helicase, partial [Deltaproteobacteria bacterium]|nr:DEAD/DEAH box helicase [Nannocystaceae bacterium]